MSFIELPTTYNAMAITKFGDADTLRLIERPLQLPATGEVLIKVSSAAVNPIDVKTRAGLGWAAQQNADKLPFVAGYDCYGEVVAVGDGVSEFSEHDMVVGMVGFPLVAGCYAQYVLAQAANVTTVGNDINADIAALPLAGLTAYQGLFEFGQLQAGDTVVISAAAGGVGHIAVQLAAMKGAHVIAVASVHNHQMLSELGATQVINYHELSQFESLTNVDLWLDLIGGDAAIEQLALAGEVKRLVTVPTMSAAAVCNSVTAKGTIGQGMLVKPELTQLIELVELVEKGKLRLNIVKQLDFKLASEAHMLIEQANVSGKIVLTMD
ncbi:MAG: NADP-dependent oxidoreductase [Gammaproteobacteria bacterium]|nr:NADP-dependent oxidoreductase [Gammaproteobacteria bacterium]